MIVDSQTTLEAEVMAKVDCVWRNWRGDEALPLLRAFAATGRWEISPATGTAGN